jgi:TPR repeat protein
VQIVLGYRHAYGLGVPKSCTTAVLYYNPVAEQVVEMARHPGTLPQVGSAAGLAPRPGCSLTEAGVCAVLHVRQASGMQGRLPTLQQPGFRIGSLSGGLWKLVALASAG